MKSLLQILGLFILSSSFCVHAQNPAEAELLVHRGRIQISPVEILNSPFRETNLSITPDGKYLYFMSLRGGQPWSRTFITWQQDSVFDVSLQESK